MSSSEPTSPPALATTAKPDPEAATVAEELGALYGLLLVFLVVLIVAVFLQCVQTVVLVLRRKQKPASPSAVVVQTSSARGAGETPSKERSAKVAAGPPSSSSSRHTIIGVPSLPSKRLSTLLSLSTESECAEENSVKKCRPQRRARSTTIVTATGHSTPSGRTGGSIPSIEMTPELAASLKMINCTNVVNTPLPTTAPLAVPPSSSSSSKSASRETIEEPTSSKEKLSAEPVVASKETVVAPPPAVTPTSGAPPTAAGVPSPAVESTQRGSVVESVAAIPPLAMAKQTSPVKTALLTVVETPAPAPVAPAAAIAPPQ